jgi:hypothetical protein
MSGKSLENVVSAFGQAARDKLGNPAITGGPEDQLRGPLEALIEGLAVVAGLARAPTLVPETRLADIKTRPDFAVTVENALVGFIEVKAPGKGADPRRFQIPHDKEQWAKLKSLPNLLYTDGNAFSLWRDGVLAAAIVHLDGDVETSGRKLAAPPALTALVTDFLTWKPTPPRSARRLAEVSARLCRLLRDEVTEQLARNSPGLTGLAADWRKLLFPQADDAQFADGYAQAVTFGLLIARTRGIPLAGGIERAATELKRSNTLIGTALGLLTVDPANQEALKTSLGTMGRVLDTVVWEEISKDDPDAWLYFYEHFLEVYDNALRKRTGSYYTPPEVVNAMVRLVDEALRGPLFERPLGLASGEVTVADPAVGTGTFLLGVLRRIAGTVEADLGPGAVPGAITAAADRLIGFELQFGPFAVAQLRLIAELQALMKVADEKVATLPALKLYITDALANPYVEQEEWIPQIAQPIAKSRRDANAIKRNQPITVVIGNPPYKNAAEGRGGWIEAGSTGRAAPMEWWRPPAEWGAGAHSKHMKNLYVYFWRWASWKVFGAGHNAATGLPETDEEGIVCFITIAGFLNGPGFQRMRADLRKSCSDIWVIDCSPERHQPEVATRIFQGVQQPVCIVLAAKKLGKDEGKAARVWFRALPEGRREEKFTALGDLTLGDSGWTVCPTGWREPFLPAAIGSWSEFPALKELFVYDGSGVMTGRTWVIAPDRQSLARRWKRLIEESVKEIKENLFHPHQDGDKTVTKRAKNGLSGHDFRSSAVIDDTKSEILPTRYGFRSFDRQWLIPDYRLINRPNPKLWADYSSAQIFMTALERAAPVSGPSITFTACIPDLDHYKGSFGGRVFPLWRDAAATIPNVHPELLALLAEIYGRPVSPEDVMAYVAALLAHPAFTARFARDLVQPGLRVPLTADAALFARAAALGREVVWLHCYGERFHDAAAGRPKGPPRLPPAEAPTIPADGAIPGAPEPLPDIMAYDAATQCLAVGAGRIDRVTPAMWAYEVSGKQVLWHWFSYRRRDRTRPVIGDRRPPSPLDAIQPESWLPEYTEDLMNLLHVLGRLVRLEPAQAALLDEVLDSPLIALEVLRRHADHETDSKRRNGAE